MKVKQYQGFRVAKCDVDEALSGRWRAEAGDVDVVRVSAPEPELWPALRAAGFLCKPKLIRWYAPAGADAVGYLSQLSPKDRRNLRNAEAAAARAELSCHTVGPIDQALMAEFLRLYGERISEMRRGVDIAGGIRDKVVNNPDFHAIVMREAGGELAGAVIARVSHQDGALRINVSAVTSRWRRASLTRVLYTRAAGIARELGLPRLSAGTDPNLFGLIAAPGLYSFKVRLGFVPTAPQRYLPDEAEHEADLLLRLDQLHDPALIAAYRHGGDSELVLHVFGSDPTLDLRSYRPGLAASPVFHQVGGNDAPVLHGAHSGTGSG